jgi:tetratricopeptide (TPR) repeat protein
VGPEELGFSLARLAAGVPHTTAGLQALVDEHAGPVRLEHQPWDPARPFPLASVAGTAPCALEEEWLARPLDPLRLVQPPRPPALDERLSAGAAALAAGQWPEARAAFRAAERLAPGTPEAALRVADAYAAEGRWSQAGAAYGGLVGTFPWSSAVRLRLGQALRAEGRVTESVRSWARALALRPGSVELRRILEGDRAAELIPPVAPPAFRVEDAAGVRWVALDRPGAAPDEAAAYARCKEAFRQSEALRLAAAGLDGARWRWSVAEETTCTVLWMAAYLAQRERGRLSDPDLDGLATVLQNGQIDERSLFDVGAPVHPQATAFLDEPARERLFQFVLTRRAGRGAGEGWLLP